MLCAIDLSARSIDRAIDRSVVSATSIDCVSIDRSPCANEGWSCTIDHAWPSIDVYTVRHVDD